MQSMNWAMTFDTDSGRQTYYHHANVEIIARERATEIVERHPTWTLVSVREYPIALTRQRP